MPEISFSCDLDTSEQALYRLLRFFTKIRAHLRRCSSFAQKVTLRLACSVTSALAMARCRYQPFAGSRVQPLHRKHVGAKSALRLLSNYDPLRWARSWFSCYNSGYLFCQRFPRRSKLCIACSDFLQKSERTYAAAPPLRKRSCSGSPARLQAPSRRLAAATNLLRVRGFKSIRQKRKYIIL